MKKNMIKSKIGVQLILAVAVAFIAALAVLTLISQQMIFYYMSRNGEISVWYYNFANFAMLGATAFTFLLVFLLLVNKKVRYIKYVSERIKKITNEELGATIEVKGKDEIAELCKNINFMSVELKKRFDREREIENAKSDLITGVSHDLRTPLTSIIGYVDLIRKKENINEEELKEYLETIYNKSHNLKNLVNQLFEYTKLSSPDVALNLNKVDLSALLEQLVGEYTPIFEKKGLTIKKYIPHEDIVVNVDIEKIVRVVDNIFTNAEKYSDKPSEVTVKLFKEKDNILICISNSARNFSEGNLQRVFEKFYREDKSRGESDGAGLGLAIAKRIAELHGGRIWGEYHKDTISFNIELPVRI